MRGMVNGSRPQNVGPMGGRGRGPPGRVDPSRKAVFRNREQDLQDPDYHRNNRYRCFHIPFELCVCTVARPQRHKFLKRADYISSFPISHVKSYLSFVIGTGAMSNVCLQASLLIWSICASHPHFPNTVSSLCSSDLSCCYARLINLTPIRIAAVFPVSIPTVMEIWLECSRQCIYGRHTIQR